MDRRPSARPVAPISVSSWARIDGVGSLSLRRAAARPAGRASRRGRRASGRRGCRPTGRRRRALEAPLQPTALDMDEVVEQLQGRPPRGQRAHAQRFVVEAVELRRPAPSGRRPGSRGAPRVGRRWESWAPGTGGSSVERLADDRAQAIVDARRSPSTWISESSPRFQSQRFTAAAGPATVASGSVPGSSDELDVVSSYVVPLSGSVPVNVAQLHPDRGVGVGEVDPDVVGEPARSSPRARTRPNMTPSVS